MTATTIPLALRHSIENGECILFIGAGVGWNTTDTGGKPAPDGATLAKEMATHFGIEGGPQPDLAKIAQVVELRRGRAELDAFLTKRLSALEPDESLTWLFSLPWRAIFTTNYDRVIKRAYEKQTTPSQTPVAISCTSEFVAFNPPFEVPVYYLHGSLFDVETPFALITEGDYAKFRERRRMLFEALKMEATSRTILYVGYSNRDQNWKMVWQELREEFLPSQPPRSYRVAPTTDDIDREILKAQGVETIDADLNSFRTALTAETGTPRVDPRKVQQIKGSIPSDLAHAFEKQTAPTARLISNWEYVNQAKFSDPTNIPNFLRGDRATWSTIAAGGAFERDLEEPLFDAILDHATSNTASRQIHALLGTAGAGVSTLLMQCAVKVVHDQVGAVFVHRSEAPLLAADIEFASTIFTGPIFFVIDEASRFVDSIQEAADRLRESKRSSFFLLGERINSWRMKRPRLGQKETFLDELSDEEILRLLDLLEKNNELGVLMDLPMDARVAAIAQKHEKQLLVAMREATEGRAFDAIVESEFRSIRDDLSRKMYLAVCGAYHLRRPIRDQVLAAVLSVGVVEMYENTNAATDGIVRFEVTNKERGEYAARARHQTIAEIVWQRCAQRSERDEIVLTTLRKVNLSIAIDFALFDEVIRTDAHVESLSTLDQKMAFFEEACRKDPTSPYVRQHYSRMLLREDKPELALAEVERGLELSSKNRVLLHTKGLVLMRLSELLPAIDLARKRMMQGEQSFRVALRLQKRDAYPYQGLIDLYLMWVKRNSGTDEGLEYLRKAEEVLLEGLREVREKESLWLASSRIQKQLGDMPGVVADLERAVKSNPKSIVSRYLLGRVLRKEGRYRDAADVLQSILNDDPNEFRSGLELSYALLGAGEPLKKAVAVLALSSTFGVNDATFVTTYGGLLNLSGRWPDGNAILDRAANNETLASEEYVRFRPNEFPGVLKDMTLTGTVVAVKRGYSFVETPENGKFFLAGRKSNRALKKGLKLKFAPEFSIKGPEVGVVIEWL